MVCVHFVSVAALCPAPLGPLVIDANACRAVLDRTASERAAWSAPVGSTPPGHPERVATAVSLTEAERQLYAELNRRWRPKRTVRAA